MKDMKKFLTAPVFLVSICMMLVLSCEKDEYENTCGVDDPVKELSWLKDQIETVEMMNPEYSRYYYIKMAAYKGETVFITGNCNPFADSVFIVYNCNGEMIGYLGYSEDYVNPDLLKNEIVIWQSENTACVFQ
jgi:hypothetical protein